MTKTLLKKQIKEVFAWVYQDKKTGQMRDKKSLIGYCALYILVFVFLIAMFFMMAMSMCGPLVNAGFSWLYFALMGLLGVTFGVFGSVFNTYATLYLAKDNDLLLAMPVPVKTVLISRLSGVFVMGLMYEMLVMIPAVTVYLLNARLSVTVVVFSILIPLILSIFVLTLSCILGWIVACLNGRMKNRKILTVLFSLLFVVAYYFLCGNINTILQSILIDPGKWGGKIKGLVYPLYQMGKAAEGNVLAMLIFTGMIFLLFAVIYAILRISFLKLATSNRGSIRVKYVEKTTKSRTPDRALLGKELRRFLGSTVYMLNCGLGIIFILAAAVVLVIKREMVQEMILSLTIFSGQEGMVSLLLTAAICTITTMNDITAPSISLEGKNLWLTQVLPVSPWKILKAKLNMHLILTLVPVAVLIVCVEWIVKPSPIFALLIPVFVVLFVLQIAMLGLVCNLKMPNLNWTSEVVPVKQGASVGFTLLGGMVIVIILSGIYYLLRHWISPLVFIISASFAAAAVDAILYRWLKTKGSRIFEML